jgi:hypothetical protein
MTLVCRVWEDLSMSGRVVAVLVLAELTAAACGGAAEQTKDATPQPASASSPKTASAPAKPATGPMVAGEPFGPRIVVDQQQGGLPVGAFSAPLSWQFESQVAWNYTNYDSPVSMSMRTWNPKNEEAVFSFNPEQFFMLRPYSPYLRPGQSLGGLIYAQPMAPFDALASFIRRTRQDVGNLQFVGGKELPGLAAALQMPPAQGQHGVGIRVSYSLNGKPTEEEFYAVYYTRDVPYNGPQGQTIETFWGLSGLHSFRGPAGTLDQRRPIFAAIAKSFKPNPGWKERYVAITKYLAEEFNRQLQAGYDQIAAAAAMSRAISANNDAMLASIDRQLRSSPTYSGMGSTATGADKFSDYLRGVETTDDPYYGTSQHSINEQFHWTDGYGAYVHTNDTTYDPNRTEVGNWTLLKNIR